MSIVNLTPDNEAVRKMQEHWQKLFAIYMHSRGISEIIITLDEVAAINAGPMPFIMLHDQNTRLVVKLFGSETEALAYWAEAQNKKPNTN